jgi:hypothetical protein
MEKRMEPLIVTTREGQIWLEQDLGRGEDSSGVVIDTSQVPTLIEWLQEAVRELKGE